MISFHTHSLIGLLTCLISLSLNANVNGTQNQPISFHEVDLVCGAATDMGCGSRSKPILIDLENENPVKEAWLNRPGTVVGVVWEEGQDPNLSRVKSIFRKHGISMRTLKGKAYEEQVLSFQNDKWYKGIEVDELSMEEAGRIAGQIIDPLIESGMLNKEDGPAMYEEIESYIQNEFLTLQDVKLLSQRSYYLGWEQEIQKIARKYMAEKDVAEIRIVGQSFWTTFYRIGLLILVVGAGMWFVKYYRKKRKSS